MAHISDMYEEDIQLLHMLIGDKWIQKLPRTNKLHAFIAGRLSPEPFGSGHQGLSRGRDRNGQNNIIFWMGSHFRNLIGDLSEFGSTSQQKPARPSPKGPLSGLPWRNYQPSWR